MKKNDLREKGIKLCERDLTYNGFYAETDCYYLLNNALYCIQEVDNNMNYIGENTTSMLCPDVKNEIRNTTDLYWQVDMGLTKEGYEKLCTIYERDPSHKYMKENDRIDLPTTLKAYFLSLGNGSLKEVYDRLCALEKQFRYEKYDEEPEPYFAARTTVCRSLLGDMELYKLFPEEGIRGTFENDYCDDMKWREKYYFEKYIPGTLDKEIDRNDPEYKNYREKLYQGTISKICDEYASYIFAQLSDMEKGAIENGKTIIELAKGSPEVVKEKRSHAKSSLKHR